MIGSKNDETRLIVRFRDHLESEEFVGKRAFTLINDNDLEEEDYTKEEYNEYLDELIEELGLNWEELFSSLFFKKGG